MGTVLVLAGLLTATTTLATAPVASAAPAGQPGTPGTPPVLFQENFQNGSGVTELEAYPSSSGTAYTASPYWLDALSCNGFVVSPTSVQPAGYCYNFASEWAEVLNKTIALGLLNSPQNPTTNRAASSNTSGPNTTGNQIEFATTGQLTLSSANRFVTFSVDAAATACTAAHPLLRFYLRNNAGTEIPVSSSAIDPCTDPRSQTSTINGSLVTYGRYPANGSLLLAGNSLGIVMRNQQGSAGGNDGAFDNIRVLDVTPQLDKSFSPTTVAANGVTTLTLTVTNTSELAAKSGWAFTDNLPAGLRVAPTPALGGTCVATRTAAAGATSIAITNGQLAAGQVSCTITVNVVQSNPLPSDPISKPYQNCAANFSNVIGMDLPNCATVTFTRTPAITIVKSANPTTLTGPNQNVTYNFLVTNTGNTNLANVTVTETAFSGTGVAPVITCPAGAALMAPATAITCTATYTATQADATAGQINNTAVASGTAPGAAGPTTSAQSSAQVNIAPNPPLSCTTSVYQIAPTGQIFSLPLASLGTSANVTSTSVVTPPAGVTAANALAVGAGGTTVIYYGVVGGVGTIFELDVATGIVTQTNAAVLPNTAAGAINPLNGLYYIGGPAAGSPFYAYNPVTNALFQVGVSPAASLGGGGNGDIAFGANGDMYLLRDVTLIRVPAASVPTTPGTGVLPGTLVSTGTFNLSNGIAFDAAGFLYVENSGSPSVIQRLNPLTGAVIGVNTTTTVGGTDLATCATPPTLALRKSVTSRFAPGDQFNLNIASPGTITQTATTTGTATGLQAAIAGPTLGAAGRVFTLSETGAGGTNVANYNTTYSCVDTANGNAPIASGTGRTFNLTYPTPNGQAIVCTFTNAPVQPELTLVKSVTPNDQLVLGQTLTYSFLVTNTGNVTVNGITIAETAFSGSGPTPAATCPAGAASLAPGASVTCTATYTVTQADVDSGQVTNTAVANGTTPGGVPVPSNPDDAQVPGDLEPALTVTKSATPATGGAVGDVITYNFLVRNTGNVSLTDITVNEGTFTGTGTLSAITCPATPASLIPGATITCTATYTLTQADVNTGSITNTATATGTPPTGPPVDSPPDEVEVPIPPAPALTIDKTASPTTVVNAGDVITYSFLVTNTGNVTLTDVTVDETAFSGTGTNPVITCPAGAASLAPGATVTCTASYTTTQADINAGEITNTAIATGTPPTGPPVDSPPDTVEVPAIPAPSLTVAKSATPTTGGTVGQVITYSFLVTNTGNVTLTDVVINEGAFSGSGTLSAIVCPAGAASLAPDATITCTATYTLTAADVDAGEVTNVATATGTPPTGPPVDSPPDEVEVPIPPAPGLAIIKSANPTTITNVGDQITYSFVITNTGNVTLTDVTVEDTAFSGTGTPLNITCPAGAASLAAGTSIVCSATYLATQSDVNAGEITNTANATGTPPTGPPVDSPPDDAEVTIPPAPALTIDKTSTTTDLNTVGQVVPYNFLVTNTGNVTLTNVTVSETVFTGTGTPPVITCPAGAASLAPGAFITCTASYTLTQADVDNGDLTNTAVATGTPPTGPPVDSPPDTVEIPSNPQPALTINKSATPATGGAVGQVITYSFVVTNTGNVTMTDIVINDVDFSGTGTLSAITCPAGAASLIPGASVTCTATYTLTQADVNTGEVTNVATATGTPPAGPPVDSPPDEVEVPIPPAPALTVDKSATPATGGAVGDVITYSFLVTNTGNVTLTDIVVNDVDFSGTGTLSAITCPAGAASLIPGASVTCTATYTLTQADVNTGEVTNVATATGTPPTGPPVDSPPDEVEVPIPPAPALSILKVATPATGGTVGDVITYSFVVTNTGNVTMTDIVVNDVDFTGTGTLSAITCPAGAASLIPGDTVTCTASYTLTQADVNTGSITNTATATGTPPTGPPVDSPPDEVEVPIPPAPALTIVKSSPTTSLNTVGQVIPYNFVVTNTGNVTLTDVVVNDVQFSGTGNLSAITCPAGAASMASGAQIVCTASYTLTQADVDAGELTNTATATGTPPTGPPVDSPPDSYEIPSDPQPAITVDKTADPATGGAVGDVITYSFLVTNTGNVSLSDITVNEGTFTGTGDLSDIVCPATPAVLIPGQQITCTATYTLTQADVNTGSITNTATATGTPPTGPPVDSPPDEVEVPIPPAPALTIVKSSPTTSLNTVGQVIPYNFVVTNTGNVTLTDVVVNDVQFSGTGNLSAITCPADAASMDAGEQIICTASYTLTQADVDAGELTNTATATGTPPTGPPVDSPPDSYEIPSDPQPAITVDKTADPATGGAVGDVITYSFLVTNTGNVSLSNITVNEGTFTGTGDLSAIVCPATPAVLIPGQQITCTASYTLTQADVNTGSITNTATATGTPPTGPPVDSPPDEVEVPIPPAPALTVDKSASPATAGKVGDVITYSFLVTNTGNVTLADIVVNDVDFSGTGTLSAIVCPAGAASLIPGASVTCTATYTLTQADVNTGEVTNVATATGTPPTGPPVDSPPDEVEVPIPPRPALTVDKTATPATAGKVGDVITYSFLVTNTGNVTLTDVVINDVEFSGTGDLSAITCSAGAASLAPGASVTCTATYTLTAADVDAGEVTNVATATGTPPTGPPVDSPPDEVEVPIPPAPSIAIVKSASPSDAASFTVGQEITYGFLVTNTGNVTLTDVTVIEGVFTGSGDLSAIVCPAGAASLASGASIVCTATYTITQADVDAGKIVNDATSTGTPPTGPPVESPPSEVEIPSVPNPQLTIDKTADKDSIVKAGEKITYSFLVTNTGNVTLTDVTVNEGMFTGTGDLSPIVCPAGAASLAPGASITCTATYVTTQADVDSGKVSNTAVGSGTPPTGPPVDSPPDTVEVPTPPAPAITVVKTASPNTSGSFVLGQVVTYSFLVTNTGNVTLADVTVNEGVFTGTGELSAIVCPAGAASLAPGGQITCTATYTITQADVDAGKIVNDATVTGTPPGTTPPPVSPPSEVTIPGDPVPSLSLVKTSDLTVIKTAGQLVTYNFLVTNTGNTTISNVTVTEGSFSGTGSLSAVSCLAGVVLAPGEQTTCTATYVTTAQDVAAGQLLNTATVSGDSDGPGPDPVSPPSSAVITMVPPVPPVVPPLPNTGVAGLPEMITTGSAMVLLGLLLMVGLGRRNRRTLAG